MSEREMFENWYNSDSMHYSHDLKESSWYAWKAGRGDAYKSDRIATEAASLNDRQAMRIAELTLVLRQISEWAEPMREGPRDCIPNWFYEMRRVLAHNWAKEIEK